MALTQVTSAIGGTSDGKTLAYILLPLAGNSPSSADLTLLAAQLNLGYVVKGFTVIDSSNAGILLEKTVV